MSDGMSEREQFLRQGYIHCPECWTRNLPTAATCRKCGASMVAAQVSPEPAPDPQTRRAVNRNWLKGYAVGMWVLTVVIFVVSMVVSVIQFAMGHPSQALLWFVAGSALAVIHMLIGRGLWHERRWARQAGLGLHGTVIGYALITIVYSFVNPGIAVLDYVLRPVILLGLIGVMALWFGMHAEEGERLAIYGPDPDSLAEMREANTATVSFPGGITEAEWLRARAPMPDPYDDDAAPAVLPQRVNLPEPELDAWETEQGQEKKQWEKLQTGALTLGGILLFNYFEKHNNKSTNDEGGSKRGKRRRSGKRGSRADFMRSVAKLLKGND